MSSEMDYCRPETIKNPLKVALKRRIDDLYIRLEGLSDRKTYFFDHACPDNDYEKQGYIMQGRIHQLNTEITELKRLVNEY